ncbi:MAG: IclR family transcriptional regulator [Roseicyclus sp.]|nr:IclR family transcriptional regulator [Roseicyclus sp.]
MARSTESSIVTKCALIIDVISQSRHPLAFAEIVARTGFVKSSCHRILAVLQGEDMVNYDRQTRTYHTGPRLRRWARSNWQRTDLQDVAGPTMDRLCEDSGTNTALSIFDDQFILYLRTSDYTPIRFADRAGDRAPLHCTAAGKVFLAHMTDKRRADTLSTLKLEKFTEFTKTNREELEAELSQIVRQGYARAVREEYLHVLGMAAPLWNAQGQVVACLSMWTVADFVSAQQMEDNAPKLLRAAAEISARIG